MERAEESALFVNAWSPEKDPLLPAFRRMVAQSGKAAHWRYRLLLFALGAAAAGLYAFGYGRYGWFPMALLALLLWARFMLPGILLLKLKKQWDKCKNALSVPCTVFYGSRFCYFDLSARREAEARYGDLTWAFETDALLVLMLGEKKPVFLSKARLGRDETRAFQAFLREKAPEAKFHFQNGARRASKPR